jgi:hypothetical protein
VSGTTIVALISVISSSIVALTGTIGIGTKKSHHDRRRIVPVACPLVRSETACGGHSRTGADYRR